MALKKLESAEHNAVLAGLRLLQLFVEGRISAPGIDDVLTNGDTEESLSVEAIDDLCETVNCDGLCIGEPERSEEHTSELQSLMRISYAVFCLKKQKRTKSIHTYVYLTNKQ